MKTKIVLIVCLLNFLFNCNLSSADPVGASPEAGYNPCPVCNCGSTTTTSLLVVTTTLPVTTTTLISTTSTTQRPTTTTLIVTTTSTLRPITTTLRATTTTLRPTTTSTTTTTVRIVTTTTTRKVTTTTWYTEEPTTTTSLIISTTSTTSPAVTTTTLGSQCPSGQVYRASYGGCAAPCVLYASKFENATTGGTRNPPYDTGSYNLSCLNQIMSSAVAYANSSKGTSSYDDKFVEYLDNLGFINSYNCARYETSGSRAGKCANGVIYFDQNCKVLTNEQKAAECPATPVAGWAGILWETTP